MSAMVISGERVDVRGGGGKCPTVGASYTQMRIIYGTMGRANLRLAPAGARFPTRAGPSPNRGAAERRGRAREARAQGARAI